MTTTTQQKPIPDTRYAKQGAPPSDFIGAARIGPPVPEIDDFVSDEHTLPVPENSVVVIPAKKE